MELEKLTALQLADKIKKHEVSVLDGVKDVFSKIEEKDNRIHAYLDTYKKEAYARAKEVEKGIEDGTYTGPLAGVPIAIKDNICVQGKPTTCASKILEGFVPQYQAEVISRLEKAGMIIIGKTNMDEFAMGSTTETSAYGITRNPWNTEHVPGGSSGGSCAAVAAGDPPAKLLLWCNRNEAYLWYGFPLWAGCICLFSGSDRTDWKRCGRLRSTSGSDRWP